MRKKLLIVVMAIASAVGIAVAATTAFAGGPMPLPNGTTLSIISHTGPYQKNTLCPTGSCFSMAVNSADITLTDLTPGTDNGLILGKDQVCGDQIFWPAGTATGDVTTVWNFFSNNGSNCTAPSTATSQTGALSSVTTGASDNIFDIASCTSAANCVGRTKLGSWHVAWNGIVIPMGSALGCKATDPSGCLGVTEWTLDPSPVPPTGSTYVLKHTWVVPNGDPSGFGNVVYTVILRGTVTLPPLCADMASRCDDGNACTKDECDSATGACSHSSAQNCDDNNDCTIDDCNAAIGCYHINVNDGSLCNDSNKCTLGDVCTINSSGVSTCTGTSKVCTAPDACTSAACDTATGECAQTTKDCSSNNSCITDTCDPATGCVHRGNAACANSVNNNFTMLDPSNQIIGGTNDVKFIYNKAKPLTSVSASGQVSNATISSDCPFFGNTWTAHDVAVYAPGTYTVYADCPAGSPGCGQGTPITFTIQEGELGGHMLFNWSSNKDIDVVDIWTPQAKFGPTQHIYTGVCGVGNPDQVWDLMSKDVDGNGVNGLGMVDGPFINFNANFNVMETPNISPPTKPELVFPADQQTGLPTTVDFVWKRSTDLDNDPITYDLTYCTNSALTSAETPTTGCTSTPVTVASRSSKGIFYAGGAGMLMIGMTFIGGLKGRRMIVLLFIVLVLVSGGALISCTNTNSSNAQGKFLDIGEMRITVSGLSTKTTYYWKVTASDGKAPTDSDVNSFTTQ
jgi:hypothetical protein